MRAALLALLLCMPVHAGIVDGVAVAMGKKVITRSEIDLRIRLTAFQNHEPADFSIESRRAAAERLIDQRIVDKEMDVGRYPRLAQTRAQQILADYIKSNYNGDRTAFLADLSKYDLTEKDVAEDLARQSDFLTFLGLRFRPDVQVSDRDKQSAADHKEEPGIDGLRTRIEERITSDHADSELDSWLRDQRKRTSIDYVEKDLAEAPAK